jgi:hypothetical protein
MSQCAFAQAILENGFAPRQTFDRQRYYQAGHTAAEIGSRRSNLRAPQRPDANATSDLS